MEVQLPEEGAAGVGEEQAGKGRRCQGGWRTREGRGCHGRRRKGEGKGRLPKGGGERGGAARVCRR